jgi:hypothetical protein
MKVVLDKFYVDFADVHVGEYLVVAIESVGSDLRIVRIITKRFKVSDNYASDWFTAISYAKTLATFLECEMVDKTDQVKS